MTVNQIRTSLTVLEETAVEKPTKALKRAERAEEIQQEKTNKGIKGLIHKSDHGL